MLFKLSRNVPLLKKRNSSILVSFHPQYRARTIPYRHLKQLSNVKFVEEGTTREELWKIHGDYAFVVSPRGIGLDTHRTYEALFLGCIVIVLSSSLDELFEDLPVVIVSRWDEITHVNLEKWFDTYKSKYTMSQVHDKLMMSHWIERIRSNVI